MDWKGTTAAAALLCLGSGSALAAQREATEEDPAGLLGTLSVTAGAGVEGFTGDLNGRVNPGPAWNATVGVQPLPWLGTELAYTGAANEVKSSVAPGEGLANGADIVRSGGQVVATASAPIRYLQPYLLVGLGIDHYNVRGDVRGQPGLNPQGFRDDTAGRVPLGGGLRTVVGFLNADARIEYDALFADQFSSPNNVRTTGGAYVAALNLGGRF